MIKAVLWDMDGVLIDSEPFYATAIRDMYHSIGAPLTDEIEQSMVGSSALINARRVKELYPHLTQTAEELFVQHSAALLSGLMKVKGLIDGVEDWLVRLRKDGVKLAVATSSTGEMLDWARTNLRLGELFDTIVTSREVVNAKPAPDIFLEAARRLGVSPSDCLVVEDSRNGVRAARAAGITVAVFNGAPGMGLLPDDGDLFFAKYDRDAFSRIFGQ